VELNQELNWRGRRVRWGRVGSGPAIVFCHGTPWSSWLWAPFADALSSRFTSYLWDMPGDGQSSQDPHHSVALDVQGELLHGAVFSSLALVDVVALTPWGSDFFRLVKEHAEVFQALPATVHEGALRAYIAGASSAGLTPEQATALAAPWLGDRPGGLLPADRRSR
jgi:hypothetical protein